MNKKFTFKTYMETKSCPYGFRQDLNINVGGGISVLIDVLTHYNGNVEYGIVGIGIPPAFGTASVIGNKIFYTPPATFTNTDSFNMEATVTEGGCVYKTYINIVLYKVPTFTITERSPTLDGQGEKITIEAVGGLPNQIIDFSKTLTLFNQRLAQLTVNSNLPILVTNDRTNDEVGTVQLKPDGTLQLIFLMIAEPDTIEMYADFIFTYMGIVLNPNGNFTMRADGSET